MGGLSRAYRQRQSRYYWQTFRPRRLTGPPGAPNLSPPVWHDIFATITRRHIKGETRMAVETLVLWLIIGAIAGFLAGLIVKGYGFGVVGNIVVGIVGAAFGGWLLPQLGLFTGGDIVGTIITAV